MVIAYFDCFSGIAGDMILGALLNLGVPIKFLHDELDKLDISDYSLDIKTVHRNNIAATDITVHETKEQASRSLTDILQLIEKSDLSHMIKKRSVLIFQKLAQAESKVHAIPIEKVHFHEVGSLDSIVDIVGAAIGISYLNIKKMYCSPLPLGHGFVSCTHGVLPLPAPATIELLKGIPVYSVDRNHELVTPTGAAIISSLATKFGRFPPMKIRKIGYGSGKITNEYPNLLRILLGEQRS